MTSYASPPTAGPRVQLPRTSAGDVMSAHAAKIARIQLCFGIDAATFEEQVLSIVQRLAEYVLNLPASRDAYYCQPGGMFELALDTAFFSLQGTDGHIFAGRSTISVRRHLEPRWRLATFMAGLLCILERAAGQAIVEYEAGSRWPALVVPLATWLQTSPQATYRLGWRADLLDVPGYGILALPLVVPAPILTYLSDANDEVLPSLLASIGGLPRYRDHNPLPRLVRRAFALVVNQWLETFRSGDDLQHDRSHLQRYVLDAMRRLAACHPRWVPNREKSRLWLGRDGLYLVWPQSASDIVDCFEEDELAGMPRSAASILQLLQASGVLASNQKAGHAWLIHPPSSRSPVEAIKLASSSVLYPDSVNIASALDTTLATARVEPVADAQHSFPPSVTNCHWPSTISLSNCPRAAEPSSGKATHRLENPLPARFASNRRCDWTAAFSRRWSRSYSS
ncbi:MobH family relaxase [Piscinibacter sakaiensis]|uniref:MobH family relaxase n=1 Tax=Piscinibacter sakaiensis TaxID=1547922 RepID=UPI003AAC265B